MAKKNKRVQSSTQTVFSDIPSLFGHQDHVFKTVEELDYGLRALAKILGRKSSGPLSRLSSYLLERFEVEFSHEYRHEHVCIDHARATIIIRLPKRRGEKPAQTEARRHHYLLRYTSLSEEIRTRGLIQAYRSLDGKGRRALVRRERKRIRRPRSAKGKRNT